MKQPAPQAPCAKGSAGVSFMHRAFRLHIPPKQADNCRGRIPSRTALSTYISCAESAVPAGPKMRPAPPGPGPHAHVSSMHLHTQRMRKGQEGAAAFLPAACAKKQPLCAPRRRHLCGAPGTPQASCRPVPFPAPSLRLFLRRLTARGTAQCLSRSPARKGPEVRRAGAAPAPAR